MITILAGALLMIAASLTGIGVRRIYRERFRLFNEFQKLTVYLEREVAHLKTPIVELLENYCINKKGRFCEIIGKYLGGLRYGYASSADVLALIKTAYLYQADNLIIADFLFGLGKGDLETEITNLQRYNGIFTEKTSFFKQELKEKGEMYYKLSVLIGVTLMILVV